MPSRYELGSIPDGQTDRISGFVEGARASLKRVLHSCEDNPMEIDIEFRDTGNCHIWLLEGKWIDGKANFDAVDSVETVLRRRAAMLERVGL